MVCTPSFGSGGSMRSPLVGKLFDETGERLTPSHAVKGNRRYRYYVSSSLLKGAAGQTAQGWRIPAMEIEHNLAAALPKFSRTELRWFAICTTMSMSRR